MKINGLFICIFIYILILSAGKVSAHKVNVFADVDGKNIHVAGYFPDGKPSKNSKIEVFNPENKLIVEGVTDDKGEFVFKSDLTENFKIIMTSSMGHKAEYILSITDNKTQEKQNAENKQVKKDNESVPWINILAGLGFIFGLTGLIISLSANNKIEKLKCKTDPKHKHPHNK